MKLLISYMIISKAVTSVGEKISILDAVQMNTQAVSLLYCNPLHTGHLNRIEPSSTELVLPWNKLTQLHTETYRTSAETVPKSF